jgi:hypothetical protein
MLFPPSIHFIMQRKTTWLGKSFFLMVCGFCFSAAAQNSLSLSEAIERSLA